MHGLPALAEGPFQSGIRMMKRVLPVGSGPSSGIPGLCPHWGWQGWGGGVCEADYIIPLSSLVGLLSLLRKTTSQ